MLGRGLAETEQGLGNGLGNGSAGSGTAWLRLSLRERVDRRRI